MLSILIFKKQKVFKKKQYVKVKMHPLNKEYQTFKIF